jgi:hypothetical protein
VHHVSRSHVVTLVVCLLAAWRWDQGAAAMGCVSAPHRSGEAPMLPSADDLGRGDETPTAGGPKCSKEKNRQVGCQYNEVCTAAVVAIPHPRNRLAAFTWPVTGQASLSAPACHTLFKRTAGK